MGAENSQISKLLFHQMPADNVDPLETISVINGQTKGQTEIHVVDLHGFCLFGPTVTQAAGCSVPPGLGGFHRIPLWKPYIYCLICVSSLAEEVKFESMNHLNR